MPRYEFGQENKTQEKNKIELLYVNKLLSRDGDFIIVRFPYKSVKEFDTEVCHQVNVPGNKFAQFVECTRTETEACPICEEGHKTIKRFFVKAIAYLPDEKGVINIVPVVWNRPINYAYELKDKLDNYGDFDDYLFKITRHGTGTNTNYTTDIIMITPKNKDIYKPEIYRKEFDSINQITPSKFLMLSMKKYLAKIEAANKAKNPSVVEEKHVEGMDFPEDDDVFKEFATPTPTVETKPEPVVPSPVEQKILEAETKTPVFEKPAIKQEKEDPTTMRPSRTYTPVI